MWALLWWLVVGLVATCALYSIRDDMQPRLDMIVFFSLFGWLTAALLVLTVAFELRRDIRDALERRKVHNA